MHKYEPYLKRYAQSLRSSMTDSERALWRKVRGKQLLGIQFYRQKPIGPYIVDFYAPRAALVIEIDGSQHLDSTDASQDAERDKYLADNGLQVLRFFSNEVLTDLEAVVEVIYETVKERCRS